MGYAAIHEYLSSTTWSMAESRAPWDDILLRSPPDLTAYDTDLADAQRTLDLQRRSPHGDGLGLYDGMPLLSPHDFVPHVDQLNNNEQRDNRLHAVLATTRAETDRLRTQIDGISDSVQQMLQLFKTHMQLCPAMAQPGGKDTLDSSLQQSGQQLPPPTMQQEDAFKRDVAEEAVDYPDRLHRRRCSACACDMSSELGSSDSELEDRFSTIENSKFSASEKVCKSRPPSWDRDGKTNFSHSFAVGPELGKVRGEDKVSGKTVSFKSLDALNKPVKRNGSKGKPFRRGYVAHPVGRGGGAVTSSRVEDQ